MLQERSVMSVFEANIRISKEFKIGKRDKHTGLFPIYKVDTSSHTIAVNKKKTWELFAHAKTLEQAVDITKGIVEQDPSTICLKEE